MTRFPPTSWTLLLAATGDDETAEAARAEFARRYDAPIRAFLGALLRDSEIAAELAQDFWQKKLLEGELIGRANAASGGFRQYLKAALRNHVRDWMRKEGAAIRPVIVSLDDRHAASEGDSDPDREYAQAWVRALLGRAMKRVERMCEERGQQVHFALFTGRHMNPSGQPTPWKELGAPFDLDPKTARHRAETVVGHLRSVVLETLTAEEGSPHAAESELRTLLEQL